MPLFAAALLFAANTVYASIDSIGGDGFGFVAIDRQVLRVIDELVDVQMDSAWWSKPRIVFSRNNQKPVVGDTFEIASGFVETVSDRLENISTNNSIATLRFGDHGENYVVCVGDSAPCLVEFECPAVPALWQCLTTRLAASCSRILGRNYHVRVDNEVITIQNVSGNILEMTLELEDLTASRVIVHIKRSTFPHLSKYPTEHVYARITTVSNGLRFEDCGDDSQKWSEPMGRTLCVLYCERRNLDSMLDVAPSQPYTEVLIDSDQEGASTHGSSVRYARDENGRLSFVIYHVMSIGSWQIEVRELSNDTLAVRVRLASAEADLTANPDKESGLAFHELFSSQTATIHNGRFVNVVYEQYGIESMYNRKAWSVEDVMEEIEWGRKIISK